MKTATLNFLLVVLIEAVTAVGRYLKSRLFGNLNQGDEPWANHPEFV